MIDTISTIAVVSIAVSTIIVILVSVWNNVHAKK